MSCASQTTTLSEATNVSWDVVIIGGALSGASTALEILRRKPDARVLIVESGREHGRRVGESSVEVSTFFLEHVLGLRRELNQNHIVKQGLRFFFANGETDSLRACSETGPKFNTLFPGYQIDRARLDEVVLEKALQRGARLLRPAKVTEFELQPGERQEVVVKQGEEQVRLSSRWLVDASGVRSLVGRKLGWIHVNEDHPIATAWSRWEGVLDWDDPDVMNECDGYAGRVYGVRNNATHHLMGKGWWAWWIPLKNGDVSIGVVYDQRLVELPEGERMGERLRTMLCQHPAGERLLRNARYKSGDVHFRRDIAYYSDRFADDGVALVGDAAGFLDPFYSPGLDWLAYSTVASAKLIAMQLETGLAACPYRLELHNQHFSDSYQRWFAAIYRDKYYYMGDWELMSLAFRLDLGFYYLGAVRRPFIHGRESLAIPSFGQREAKIPALIIGFYNKRLAVIARKRLASGRWGRKNARHTCGFFSYRLNWTLPARLLAAVGSYLWLECWESVANWRGALERKGEEPRKVVKPAVTP